jgi:hypothetical protein
MYLTSVVGLFGVFLLLPLNFGALFHSDIGSTLGRTVGLSISEQPLQPELQRAETRDTSPNTNWQRSYKDLLLATPGIGV